MELNGVTDVFSDIKRRRSNKLFISHLRETFLELNFKMIKCFFKLKAGFNFN